jgi:hypothetical protein
VSIPDVKCQIYSLVPPCSKPEVKTYSFVGPKQLEYCTISTAEVMGSLQLLNPRVMWTITPNQAQPSSAALERLSAEIVAAESGHPLRRDNPAYKHLSSTCAFDFVACTYTQPR